MSDAGAQGRGCRPFWWRIPIRVRFLVGCGISFPLTAAIYLNSFLPQGDVISITPALAVPRAVAVTAPAVIVGLAAAVIAANWLGREPRKS